MEEYTKAEVGTYNEQLEMGFGMMKMLAHFNLLITNADNNSRREQLYEFLHERNLKGYDEEKEKGEDYNYKVIQQLRSPKDIFDIYERHNGKLVIFDTEKLFSRKQYMDVAEGGFCSSPESGKKWPVRYQNRKEFYFKGHVIVLTQLSKRKLQEKEERYKYLLRDMFIV